LSCDFPKLVIHLRSQREGYIVYHSSAITSESEYGESSDDSDGALSPIKIAPQNAESIAVTSQLMIKNSIKNHVYQLPILLRSNHINAAAFESSVPSELTTYFRTLLESSSSRLITRSQKVKLNSICQDFMNLFSPQKVNTPKGLALGLVVKHLTGSKDVINILHKLGHSASYDTIRAYETSLAIHAISNENKIPDSFAYQKHITMVRDNIDYLEATKSGSGTTHHTNGILIQVDHQIPTPMPFQTHEKRTNYRSLCPTVEPIAALQFHRKSNPEHLLRCELPVIPDLFQFDILEFTFALIRFQTEITKPSWTGFNKLTRSFQSSPHSVIEYLKTIEKPPTDIDVVNHILQKSLDQLDKFGLSSGVVVFDQAVYAKAQAVRFLNPILQSRLVLRLGEFHTTMAFLGVRGKRCGDAGMSDILIDSQCIAAGSIKGVLNGHSYNRALRANKLLMESLFDLLLGQYVQDCANTNSLLTSTSTDMARPLINNKQSHQINENSQAIHDSIYKPFLAYVEKQCEKSSTFRFWYGYVQLIRLLLNFIRGTRESNWNLHLDSLCHMLPWFYAYDKHNYARYGTLYYVEMQNLPQTHQEIHELFSNNRGSFTYQTNHHQSFSAIACDQAIEQTINRDSKSRGGLTGMTLQVSASQRWLASHSERAAIYRSLGRMLELEKSVHDEYECSETSWKADEDVRLNIKEAIKDRINPFNYKHSKLVSIVSGNEAPVEVQADLDRAHEIGAMKLNEFVQKRITTQEVDFNCALKWNKLRTFSVAPTKHKTKLEQTNMSSGLFNRLLVVSQQRTFDLKKVLSYSLGPVSWSLAKSDGSLVKTAKCALMNSIEKELTTDCYASHKHLPKNSTIIIDGIAEIQELKPLPTFGLYADAFFTKIVLMAQSYSSCRVDFVCDSYPEISIKNMERVRRAVNGGQKIAVYGPSQKIPVKFSNFLAIGDNKRSLVRFLCEAWSKKTLEKDIIIVVAFETNCIQLKFSKHGGTPKKTELKCLQSDQEEADTRMFLHAKYLINNISPSVIIKSQDTDVFILSLAICKTLPSCQLYLFTGRGNHMRYLNVNIAASKLGSQLCAALPGFHA